MKYNWLLILKKNVILVKFGIVQMVQAKDWSWAKEKKDCKTVLNKIIMHFFQHNPNVFCINLKKKQVVSTFLIININFKYIHIIISLGFRAPSLMIKKERFIQISFLISWNYEILCHLDVECDYHYIFKCSLYNEYRKLCIKLSLLLQI